MGGWFFNVPFGGVASMKDWLFFDNNFNGLSDDVLDDVMDLELFDLPLEDVETDDGVEQDWDAQFRFLEEPSLGIFPLQSSQHCAHTQKENVKVQTRFSASVSFLPSLTLHEFMPLSCFPLAEGNSSFTSIRLNCSI